MKKKNKTTSLTEQRRAEIKRARRIRRKAKVAVAVLQKLRPLVVKLGALENQVKQQEGIIRELNSKLQPGQGASVVNTAQGQQQDSVGPSADQERTVQTDQATQG